MGGRSSANMLSDQTVHRKQIGGPSKKSQEMQEDTYPRLMLNSACDILNDCHLPNEYLKNKRKMYQFRHVLPKNFQFKHHVTSLNTKQPSDSRTVWGQARELMTLLRHEVK